MKSAPAMHSVISILHYFPTLQTGLERCQDDAHFQAESPQRRGSKMPTWSKYLSWFNTAYFIVTNLCCNPNHISTRYIWYILFIMFIAFKNYIHLRNKHLHYMQPCSNPIIFMIFLFNSISHNIFFSANAELLVYHIFKPELYYFLTNI